MLRKAPFRYVLLNEAYLLERSNSPVQATSSRIWKSIFSPRLVLTATECGRKLYKGRTCMWACKDKAMVIFPRFCYLTLFFFRLRKIGGDCSSLWSISWSPYLKKSATSCRRHFTYTVEVHLSRLIWTASHTDMKKIRIIEFFFDGWLHSHFEVRLLLFTVCICVKTFRSHLILSFRSHDPVLYLIR
jgi:hypothetical protein